MTASPNAATSWKPLSISLNGALDMEPPWDSSLSSCHHRRHLLRHWPSRPRYDRVHQSRRNHSSAHQSQGAEGIRSRFWQLHWQTQNPQTKSNSIWGGPTQDPLRIRRGFQSPTTTRRIRSHRTSGDYHSRQPFGFGYSRNTYNRQPPKSGKRINSVGQARALEGHKALQISQIKPTTIHYWLWWTPVPRRQTSHYNTLTMMTTSPTNPVQTQTVTP
jgi:hypothetical protein